MSRSLLLLVLATAPCAAAEVKGRVTMPETCSPTISPAVVTLEQVEAGAKPSAPATRSAKMRLVRVNQHGLQFEPRVQVATVGQKIQFTNQDAETHNVHILTPGYTKINQSMAPNVPLEFVADKAAVLRVVCDIHSHMRAYIVVSGSPYVARCKSDGSFRIADVPDGCYELTAWHEMGEPTKRAVEVKGGAVDLGLVELKASPALVAAAVPTAIRPWPEVVDRIGVCLAEAREAVKKPGGLKLARKLAEDAYGLEFEMSGMETAIRRQFGVARLGPIEREFLGFRSSIKEVAEGRAPATRLVDESRRLLIDLAHASDDLRRLKINTRADLDGRAVAADPGATAELPAASDQAAQLARLTLAFDEAASLADHGQSSEAVSALFDAYTSDFEPLERYFAVRRPIEVEPLEARFIAIRGRVDSGLKGEPLRSELAGLKAEVVAALGRCESASTGSFGPAFAASLVTILREGVEVILLLAMLVALVAKAGQPKAMAAIRWGVASAVVASLLTAVGLNRLVAASRGTTREIVEGAVLMAASGVLFYVSYWLVSQTQAKRWADFLKGQVARGAQVGGLGTLALTAFLAVYREGAETSLMYQAMIAGQGGSREGLAGIGAGLGLGLALLGVVAYIIRKSSVRLPMRTFFQATGYILFAMAVVFAGNGVFELQAAGIIRVTPISWLGLGIPAVGLHPNVQALSVQGILLLGAAFALVAPAFEGRTSAAKVSSSARPTAGVGA